MPGHGVQYQKGDSQSEKRENLVSGVIGKGEKDPRGCVNLNSIVKERYDAT